MNGPTRPPDPELLGFLQTLVNEGTGSPQQERTDSDKENEQARMQQEQHQQKHTSGGGDGGQSNRDDVWDDFYNEEDFRSKPPGTAASSSSAAVADHKAADDDYGRDRFESLERVEEEDEGGDGEGGDTADGVGTGSGGRQTEEGSDSLDGPKKKKKRRLFTKVRRPASAKNTPDLSAPTAAGGSHPDLTSGRGEREGGGAQLHNQQETMSETSGRGGRRLIRRKQVARPRCAGPAPSGDRLQQKYQELQMLMVRPLVEPGQYVQQTKQQLRRLEGLGRQHAQASLADSLLPPARGSASVRTGHSGHRGVSQAQNGHRGADRTAFVELSENNTEEGYSTLRTVQVTNHAIDRRPRSAQHRKLRPASATATKSRPLSATQPLAANSAHNSSVGDRVLDYVANSGNSKAGGRRKVRGKQKDDRSNANSTTIKHTNNSTSTNTDTGESTHELSTSSSQKNGAGSGDDEEKKNCDKSRDHSSSSGSSRSRSRSGSGSRRGRRTRSSSSSPCRSPRHTETHLKHSNNPALRKWLRRKDKEWRQKRKEEKAKELAEKLDKQEEIRKRDTLFKDSDKKVKEWMVKKRKEAARQAREDRRRLKEEEKERQEREAVQQQYNSPYRLTDRPQTAPPGPVTHHGRKLFIPIVRPERPICGGGNKDDATHNASKSTEANNTPSKESEGDGGSEIEPKIPRPPLASKFVYRRPVSGRVRLMKLQQEKKADAKRTELEKMLHEKKLAEEKAKKMRMSYDQWLLKKRSEDYSKRQEAAHQRALAKSDPELERIVPEMARRRIENIQRGKRRVNTGDKLLDSEVNKSFGGGDFNSDGESNAGTGNTQAASYRLEVSGTSFKQRPSSAKASLNPRVSKSPRRPQSAHPRVKPLMEESDTQKNAFKLPFPAENGAPKHVLAKQDKLFAHHITHPEVNETSANSKPAEKTSAEALPHTEAAAQATQPPPTVDSETMKNGKTQSDDTQTTSSFFVTDGNIEQPTSATQNITSSSPQTAPDREDKPFNAAENTNASSHGQSPSNEECEQVRETQKESSLETQAEVTVEQSDIQVLETGDAEEPEKMNNDEEVAEQQNEGLTTKHPTPTHENSPGDADDNSKDPLRLDLGGCDDENIQVAYEEEEKDKEDKLPGETVEDGSEKQVEEEKAALEVRASRHSSKRVSFQEETLVYEPPDLTDLPDDEDFFQQNGGDQEDNDDLLRSSDGIDDGYNDFDEEISGDDDDDDDEAEDERGNYFGNDTPRDDQF